MNRLAAHVKPYEVHLLLETTTEAELRELDPELPTDTYLVRYQGDPLGAPEDIDSRISAFRAFKSADIFDALHDAGVQVLEIKFGFGRIKPRLYDAS